MDRGLALRARPSLLLLRLQCNQARVEDSAFCGPLLYEVHNLICCQWPAQYRYRDGSETASPEELEDGLGAPPTAGA